MLRSLRSLYGYTILAIDGDFGSVSEFLFDDDTWAVKHVVTKVGNLPIRGKVLLSPHEMGRPNWSSKSIPVSLTMEDLQGSPDIDSDKPVSRQQLDMRHAFREWPGDVAAGAFGRVPFTVPQLSGEEENDIAAEMEKYDSHLWSTRDLVGYHIGTADEKVGHVDDFILDDVAWRIRYFVIDTKHWLLANRVLVSPNWIRAISWEDRTIQIGLSKESVKQSPTFDPSVPINREYEVRLYDYYGRPLDVASVADP